MIIFQIILEEQKMN